MSHYMIYEQQADPKAAGGFTQFQQPQQAGQHHGAALAIPIIFGSNSSAIEFIKYMNRMHAKGTSMLAVGSDFISKISDRKVGDHVAYVMCMSQDEQEVETWLKSKYNDWVWSEGKIRNIPVPTNQQLQTYIEKYGITLTDNPVLY